MAETLDDIRAAIDALDADLVGLLVRREALVRRAAPLKRDAGAVRAPGRVEQVVERVRALAERDGGDPDVVERIYRAMIRTFIEMELGEHERTVPR